jgi:hypothetical protein
MQLIKDNRLCIIGDSSGETETTESINVIEKLRLLTEHNEILRSTSH